MTDETRAIEPALTPEEWQALPDAAAAVAVMALPSLRRQPERMQIVMALANAALPDDDPRKITWEDVYALRNWDLLDEGKTQLYLKRLAAKLAAFLPPEG
jgi:hypothetical protein